MFRRLPLLLATLSLVATVSASPQPPVQQQQAPLPAKDFAGIDTFSYALAGVPGLTGGAATIVVK